MSSAVRAPCLRGEGERLQHRRLGARVAEVGAGGHHGAGVGDEALVDVVLGERHVGAVLAVEDQREALVVADAEEDERRQPLGVDLDAAGVDALAASAARDEAAHVLVADAGDQADFSPSRAVPQAMLVGEPPMYLWKVPMSSSRPPEEGGCGMVVSFPGHLLAGVAGRPPSPAFRQNRMFIPFWEPANRRQPGVRAARRRRRRGRSRARRSRRGRGRRRRRPRRRGGA